MQECLAMKIEKTCRNRVVSMLAGASLAVGLGLFAAPQAGAVVLGGVYQAPGLQPDIAWTSPNIVTRGSAFAFNTNADPAPPNDGLVMRLTTDVSDPLSSPGQGGSAFFSEGYILGDYSDFTMKFQFRMTGKGLNSDPVNNPYNYDVGDQRSDGIAFVVARSPSSLGTAGGDLGYGGLANTFIVEFDTHQNGFDASSSHIAFMKNGDQTTHDQATPTILAMDNGDKWEAVIQYFGQKNLLTVTVDDLDQAGNNGASFSLTGFDLPTILGNCGTAGCDYAYFGFTGATGAASSTQDILGAQLTVPEPGVIPLFAAGFAGMFLIGRRRRASLS
jgi:hypothetical protein